MKNALLGLTFLIMLPGCISFSTLDRGRLLPADQDRSSLSFTFENNLILLDVTINGTPGRFLFDNGFSLSALDKSFADKIGIRPDRETVLSDANSKRLSLEETTVELIEIGEFSFANTGAYILDTKAFMPCHQIDGIIGASIINKINWEIDMENQLITLSPKPFDGEGFLLDYSMIKNNSSVVELEVAGVPLTTKIDFGKTGSLDVEAALIRQALSGAMAEALVGITSLSATGLGNIDTTYRFFNLQPLAHQQRVLPLPIDMETSSELKYDAYLGLGYFRQYHVIINSSTSEYWLSEPSETIKDETRKYGVALYLVDGEFKIIQKNPLTPGAETLPLMEKVIKIDGQPASRFNDICGWKEYLRSKISQQDSLTFEIASQPGKLMTFPLSEPVLMPFQ